MVTVSVRATLIGVVRTRLTGSIRDGTVGTTITCVVGINKPASLGRDVGPGDLRGNFAGPGPSVVTVVAIGNRLIREGVIPSSTFLKPNVGHLRSQAFGRSSSWRPLILHVHGDCEGIVAFLGDRKYMGTPASFLIAKIFTRECPRSG